ncbi:SGNH/GDSL hydrolase family protein [Paenibacillus agricola]|nr:GDSL-type esterase/lipase family protein [Paenibacillus agricola]
MEFHNIAELEENPLRSGLKLQRFPQSIRASMGDQGRMAATQSSGCEIRFVTEAGKIRLTMEALETTGDLMVFKGDYVHSHHRLQPGVRHTILLEKPELFDKIKPELLQAGRFSTDVWRIFTCRYNAIFHELDTFGHAVRPPHADEVPKLRWLAYGSSITHGGAALNNVNTYIQQAARLLKVDVLNQGLSGACLCETEVVDYLVGREDWDLATLELGINMRRWFTPEEFKMRTTYLIEQITRKHPDKPIVVITTYPNFSNWLKEPDETSLRDDVYRQILRELVAAQSRPNLHLIEGSDILSDKAGLSCDLLHPSEAGHIQMGYNLAGKLQPIIEAHPHLL